jgi:AcrR family transcriptional regulator
LIDYVNQKIKRSAMPRTEEENQRIREEQKKNILKGAIRAFAHNGFPATKMADIAAEANVSYGLVYHYFPNKEQVLAELTDMAVQKISEHTQQALDMPGTPLDRLHWLISMSLLHLQKSPESMMVFHRLAAEKSSHNECRALASRIDFFFTEAISRLIIEGQKAGQIAHDDPALLVMALQACLRGLTYCAMKGGCEQGFPDADILLRLLKP